MNTKCIRRADKKRLSHLESQKISEKTDQKCFNVLEVSSVLG